MVHTIFRLTLLVEKRAKTRSSADPGRGGGRVSMNYKDITFNVIQ